MEVDGTAARCAELEAAKARLELQVKVLNDELSALIKYQRKINTDEHQKLLQQIREQARQLVELREGRAILPAHDDKVTSTRKAAKAGPAPAAEREALEKALAANAELSAEVAKLKKALAGLPAAEDARHSQERAMMTEEQKRTSKDSPGLRDGADAMALREAKLRIAELEGRIAFLEAKPNDVEVVTVVKPEYRTVVTENSEHVDRLNELLNEQRDQIVKLEEELAVSRQRPVEIREVERTKFVVQTVAEPRVVEVEGPEVQRLFTRLREVSQKLGERTAELENARVRIDELERKPAPVDVRTVYQEDGERIRELVEALNARERDLASLRASLHELRGRPPVVEKVEKEVYIEVPKVEVERVEVDNSETLSKLKDTVKRQDEEIRNLLAEARGHRELVASLEGRLHQAGGSAPDATGPAVADRVADRYVMPRKPLQIYSAVLDDTVDVALGQHLARVPCRIPFSRVGMGEYDTGTARVHLRLVDGQLRVYHNGTSKEFSHFVEETEGLAKISPRDGSESLSQPSRKISPRDGSDIAPPPRGVTDLSAGYPAAPPFPASGPYYPVPAPPAPPGLAEFDVPHPPPSLPGSSRATAPAPAPSSTAFGKGGFFEYIMT